ncbi:MAG: hypothetical protein IPK18_02945 [Sphingobacteriales bacterium]|nr:MAG: hypothetical protein IPK18_02945 [Sphingobacteriales bacterium]
MKNLFIILISTLLWYSCTTTKMVSSEKLNAKTIKLKGDKRVIHFIYDADSNRTYTLSEPPPDVILEKTFGILNKVKTSDKVDVEQKLDIANKAFSLGERTVAVNILRDALFRLSEMNINNRNKPLAPGYKELFDSIIAASKTIAISQIIKAEAEKINAETKNKEVEIKKTDAETKKIKAEIELQELDLNNGAYKNYQKTIKFLIDKDYKNAANYLEQLYDKYPKYFNIDPIYKELNKLSKNNKMTEENWKKLYKYIIDEKLTWKIDEELVEKIKELAK